MKPFTTIAVVAFALFALVHLARLIVGWSVIVNGMVLPMWISVVAFIVALSLAVMVWKEKSR